MSCGSLPIVDTSILLMVLEEIWFADNIQVTGIQRTAAINKDIKEKKHESK